LVKKPFMSGVTAITSGYSNSGYITAPLNVGQALANLRTYHSPRSSLSRKAVKSALKVSLIGSGSR
jgi:hypothetical protein